MISVLIIANNDKNLKKIKNISYDDLYKKCGFKTGENFEKLYEKNIDELSYEYWGKKDGKENYKYIINNITYYNKLIVIKTKDKEFQNITEEDYCNIFDNKNNEEKHTIKNKENNKENNEDSKNEDEEMELVLNSDSELSEEPYLFSSDEENE